MHQMFPFTLRARNLTAQQSPIILDLFEEDSGLKITYRVNVAFQKLRFYDGLGPVQTSSEEFDHAVLFLRLGLPSTLIRHENRAYRARFSNRGNWERRLSVCV